MPVWFVVIPMIFMLILPGLAMTINVFSSDGYLVTAMETGHWTLAVFGIATIALELWMIVEALIAWPKAKGILEEQLAPLSSPTFASEGGRSC